MDSWVYYYYNFKMVYICIKNKYKWIILALDKVMVTFDLYQFKLIYQEINDKCAALKPYIYFGGPLGPPNIEMAVPLGRHVGRKGQLWLHIFSINHVMSHLKLRVIFFNFSKRLPFICTEK